MIKQITILTIFVTALITAIAGENIVDTKDLPEDGLSEKYQFRFKSERIIDDVIHNLKNKEKYSEIIIKIKKKWKDAGLDKDWMRKTQIYFIKLEFEKDHVKSFEYSVFCPGPDGEFNTSDDMKWGFKFKSGPSVGIGAGGITISQ